MADTFLRTIGAAIVRFNCNVCLISMRRKVRTLCKWFIFSIIIFKKFIILNVRIFHFQGHCNNSIVLIVTDVKKIILINSINHTTNLGKVTFLPLYVLKIDLKGGSGSKNYVEPISKIFVREDNTFYRFERFYSVQNLLKFELKNFGMIS